MTQLGAHRIADRRQVLGRVGLAERAAERATVADDRVGDHPLGVAEDREEPRRARRTPAVAWRVSRADAHARRRRRGCNRARVRSLMSIRYSGLASRSFIIGRRLCPPATMPRLAAQSLQQRDRVVDAGGPFVLERGWYLHGCPSCHDPCFPRASPCTDRAPRSNATSAIG